MVAFAVAIFCSACRGDEPSAGHAAPLALVDPWSCVFAGSNIRLRCELKPGSRSEQHVQWRLSAGSRTLSQGSAPISDDNLRQAFVELQVAIPPLRPGVILESMLEATFADEAESSVARKPLRIFHDDPFAGRKQFLEDRAIHVFDPGEKTRTTLESVGLTCKVVRSVAALGAIEGDLVVLGEGLNWANHRGLSDAAFGLVLRGVPVLALAPADGPLDILPPSASGDNLPNRLLLAGREVIKDYDPRLDSGPWLGGASVRTTFDWQARGNRVRLNSAAAERGWPWAEISPPAQQSQRRAKWIVCGFDVVEQWKSGPVPRYLLAAILDSLLHEPEPSPTAKSEMPKP